MFEFIIHGVQGQMIEQNTGGAPSTFIPCYNKKNWHEDAWCQTDCIKQILNNPEICDWHCVDPELARTTQTNTGWSCYIGEKGISQCTNSCSCRGSPGNTAWCCGAENKKVCWNNKCYSSCALTLPPTSIPSPAPSDPPTRTPSKYPTSRNPTQYPSKMPSPYPTNFPSQFPTSFPTMPTSHPTYIYSPNYVLLRRKAICDDENTNIGITNLDNCWKACVNTSSLFVFGNQEGTKCNAPPSEDCVCRCESGQDSDALDCYRWVPNGNFDLFRIIDVPPITTQLPTYLPSSLPSNLPSEHPTEDPSMYPTAQPTDITSLPTWLPTRGCDCPKMNCTNVHCAPHQICPTCTTSCAEEYPYKVFFIILACFMGCGAIINGIRRVRKRWRKKRHNSSPAMIAMTNLHGRVESLNLPPNDSMAIGIDVSGN